MNIPTFENTRAVNEDGTWSDVILRMWIQLFNEMLAHLSERGIDVPQQSTVNLAALAPVSPNGRLLWDADLNELFVRKNDGTFHQITTL